MSESTTRTVDSVESEKSELQEELEEVALTSREETINVEITDVSKVETDEIEVEFHLPTGKKETERMEFPHSESEEYKFVRICHAAGATIDTYEEFLIGGRVPARKRQSGWELDVPVQMTRAERFRDAIGGLPDVFSRSVFDTKFTGVDLVLMGPLLPLTLLMAFGVMVFEDGQIRPEYIFVVLTAISAVIWMAAGAFFFL